VGDPRQPAQQVVEVSGSAEELADDEGCPAFGQDLGPSRDGAELPVSPHQPRLPQVECSSKCQIWTCDSELRRAGSGVMARHLSRLRQVIDGDVIQPGDPSYDEVRKVWNGAIDRSPAIIVHCAGPTDVVAAVRYARERDQLVSVRGGGHSVGGHAVEVGGVRRRAPS
jgi:hypothetical protein